LGCLAHAVLGVSNIIWFDVFTCVHAETQGGAVTIMHFVFVLLNAFVAFKHGNEPSRSDHFAE
jgi:hypothetical protein